MHWSAAASYAKLTDMASFGWITLFGALLGPTLLGCGGCGGPEATEDTSERIAPGEPEVELGSLTNSRYQTLATDPAVPVIWGTQGGTWIMPVLRVRGVASPTQIAATLVLASGEVLGDAEVSLSLAQGEGWLESQRFAVPVQHAPPHQYDPVDDLYGQSATLSVTVWDDDGRFASHEVGVLLSEP